MSDSSWMDRTRVTKTSLQAQGSGADFSVGTPGERMGLVWQLTLDAWAFKDPKLAESRFQRHAVRIVRGQG